MLTAVGAATWPVGAQVWNGHMPAIMAKPTKIIGKIHCCASAGTCPSCNLSKLNVFNDSPEASFAKKKTAIIPSNTRALPPKE